MEYTASLIWLALWPAVIYTAYRFVGRTLRRIEG